MSVRDTDARRCNHFDHWLTTLLNPDTPFMTNNVEEEVREWLQEENVNDFSLDSVKRALRECGKRAYMDYAPQLVARLTGQPLPLMAPDQKAELLNMFATIQPMLESDTFLSYAFCALKLCELANFTDFLPVLRLLQPRREDVIQLHNARWERICRDVEWRFIAS